MAEKARIPQSAWTKLHVYGAHVLKTYGAPLSAPRTLDPDVTLATAWRISTEGGFFPPTNGSQLFVTLLRRLGIEAKEVERIREVAAVLVDSPRYTSGCCNPSVNLRLQ